MPDLSVTDADIDAARGRLDAAAAPIFGSCLATDTVGSPVVSSALADVEVLVGAVLSALSTAAATAASDTAAIGSTLDQTDENLAEGGS